MHIRIVWLVPLYEIINNIYIKNIIKPTKKTNYYNNAYQNRLASLVTRQEIKKGVFSNSMKTTNGGVLHKGVLHNNRKGEEPSSRM